MKTSLCLLNLFLLPGLALAGSPAAPIVFRETTKEAGMLEPLAGIMGHGGAWGDFDGDGLIDLYVGGFCDRPNKEYLPAQGPIANHLFRNLGQGKFEIVKQPAIAYFGRTSGAVFADLDNNGTLELYGANNARAKTKIPMEPQKSAQVRRSQLFRNDKGKFVDISADSGACPDSLLSARNIGVFDYDGDGLLDLLVVEDRFVAKPRTTLFRNKGNLKFEDVNREVGLPENLYGLGIAVADINLDGRPDFFVPHSNKMFLSQLSGKAIKYREATELEPVLGWKPLDGEDWPCGAAFGDLNRDGRLDLVLAIHGMKARNKIFLNEGVQDGVPRFRDITAEAGLGDMVPVRCPHVEIQDFDNDGWPDIYISAAWMDSDGTVTPLVYRNQGAEKGMPRFVAPRKIAAPMVYYPAAPSGDYDNDGRIDLFLINWFQGNHSRLMHNESPKKNWLDVHVVGKKMNRMGIGARVSLLHAGKDSLVGAQEVSTGYGYASGQPAYCHFGLGDLAHVDVEVTIPGGQTITRKKVAANQKLVIEE